MLKLAKQNETIRARCATPGFGYVVLMLRRWGLNSTVFHTETYAEAKAITDVEIKNPDYERGALIIAKTYNHNMMIGGAAPRPFERESDATDDDLS